MYLYLGLGKISRFSRCLIRSLICHFPLFWKIRSLLGTPGRNSAFISTQIST